MAEKKVLNSDTKIKVLSNVNGSVTWISNITGRKYIFRKIGSPQMFTYEDLQDMAWSDNKFIPSGIVYIPDKEVFNTLGLSVKWDSIKPASELKKILLGMEAEELRKEIENVPSANKEYLAEAAFDNFDKLKGSTISVIEDVTKIKVRLMKENDEANKENMKKNNP